MKIKKATYLGLLLMLFVTACSGNTQNSIMIDTDSDPGASGNAINGPGFQADEPEHQTGYFYNPKDYKMAEIENEANRIIVQSFEELESNVRSWRKNMGDGCGIIVQCSVSGPSINRIIEVPSQERISGKQYGGNYVLTPVKIEKVIYAPEETGITENQITYIHEPFFYVEDKTKPYCDYYDVGTVIPTADKYTPLQEGYHFLVYLILADFDETCNGFRSYNGVVYPQISYVQDGVYCLEEEEIAKNVMNHYKGEFYWDIWREVVEHYGAKELN